MSVFVSAMRKKYSRFGKISACRPSVVAMEVMPVIICMNAPM